MILNYGLQWGPISDSTSTVFKGMTHLSTGQVLAIFTRWGETHRSKNFFKMENWCSVAAPLYSYGTVRTTKEFWPECVPVPRPVRWCRAAGRWRDSSVRHSRSWCTCRPPPLGPRRGRAGSAGTGSSGSSPWPAGYEAAGGSACCWSRPRCPPGKCSMFMKTI